MKSQKIKIIHLVLFCITTPLLAQSRDDFLRYLELRDESIKSYEIKVRRTSFTIELDDYKVFKENIEQMAQNKDEDLDSTQQAEQLVQRWTEKNNWIEENTNQIGECFKETAAFNNVSSHITMYDGQLYCRYSVRNRQLDIHSSTPNVKHADITDIGFSTSIKSLRESSKILSFKQNEEGIQYTFTFPDNDSVITTSQKYNRDLGLCYLRYELAEQILSENYYLFHKNIDGYSVPGIKIYLSRNERRNECSVHIYVIDDIKFNPVLTDEDLSLGDIPDDTLVIDYRFEPSVQWDYGEYRLSGANPDAVYTGRGRPEDMIQFLGKTSSDREALLVRDSRAGRQAPSFEIKEWLNKPIDTDTWPPDKLTVVNFWGIGCGFCIREIPENNELAEWLADKGGLFISIHQATSEPQSVLEFIESPDEKSDDFIDINKIQYTVALDERGTRRIGWNSATFNKYGIDSMPCYIIIDKDGNVISYERTVTKEMLWEILSSESNGTARQRISRKDVRKLTAIPNGWFADNLEPNSQVQGRFFIFRPDTPEIILQRSNSDNIVKAKWSQHTFSNQTLDEVIFTATAPAWGETLDGNIDIIAEHSQVFEFLTIPYELRSKDLAVCVSPIIWFGPVKKDSTATRRIVLKSAPNHRVSVDAVTVPSDVKLQINDSDQESNDIVIECTFISKQTGLQQDIVKLLATDSQNNEQTLKLEYCALVLP